VNLALIICSISGSLGSTSALTIYLVTTHYRLPSTPPTNRCARVGGNLVDFAVARSYELGYQGRIGLHALPGALGFYRKLRLGLLNCGPDPEEPDHLVYFETLRMDDP
jgi:hypothetical protein